MSFTRTCISMSERTRFLGTAAKNQMVTNPRNTIWGWKRLIGKKFRDPTVQNELGRLPYEVVEGPEGSVNVRVRRSGRGPGASACTLYFGSTVLKFI